ncbi:HK97 family phage prohead protease [Anaerosporobacter sp.]
MQIEIRSDSVLIRGYVNSTDRDSKKMKSKKGDEFVEQVRSGTWQKAIDSNDNIAVLFNHDWNKELGSTKDNLILREDNIGLYAEIKTSNQEVVEKAKRNLLSGWSFGFIKIKESWGKTDDNVARRYLDEIRLREVSILDDTKTPAYYGTLVEVRENNQGSIEQRFVQDKVEKVWVNKNDDLETRLRLMRLELEI